MASEVKWIKIMTDIFDSEKFAIIDKMPSADSIITIWFKMLVLAGKQNNNGIFFMNDRIPYTDEMLSAIFRRDLQTVRLALETFENLGMIEVIDNVYTIPNWNKYQTLDAYEKKKIRDAEYQKKRRESAKKEIENKKSSDNRLTESVTSDEQSSYDMQTIGRECSYSYILNSNSNNLLHVLEIHKDKEYILNNNELLESMKEWMEYKDQRSPKKENHYDSERGIKSWITEVVNKCRDFGIQNVISMINRAMQRNWKGVIWDGIESMKKSDKNYVQQINQKVDEEQEPEPQISDEEWLAFMDNMTDEEFEEWRKE